MTNWPVEEIPDGDRLYMRIHKMFMIEGELQPSAFRDHGAGMSMHWSKYCASPAIARAFAKWPIDNGVISLPVAPIREIPLMVVHTPDNVLPDRSHTEVRGEKTAEVRLRLLDIAVWEIRPAEQLPSRE
jgi:hypothetical protein